MIEKYIPKFLNCLYDERIKDVIPGQELIDMFHSNQINSIYEILKATDTLRLQGMPTKTLYIGSWMGFKTKLFSEYYGLNITEVELDERCKAVSEIWNSDNKNYDGHIQGDATQLNKEFYEDFKTVINPSCEHMNDEWYYNIPDGTFMILQSNDFDIPQHTNIVKNIQEMKNKYKMRDIYSCTLQCTVYQRFTLAGIKTAESILP
tara:strand:+ start:209 stop:823 length:615 start_codon:yes stop_codon:yes gene_type:complete